jgi:hypothetical protein
MTQDSADVRERLLGATDPRLPQAREARLFGVGTRSIKRWRIRQEEEGALLLQAIAAPDISLADHGTTWAGGDPGCFQWPQACCGAGRP